MGPYKIPPKGKTSKEIKTKRADVIINVIEQTLFSRYPWPTEVVLDRGTEFMAKFTAMIQRDYRMTIRMITTQNLQANGIVHSMELDKEDPWSGILGA
eukprot:3385034-Ditylum_brightwellii.AAC.1